MPNSSSTISPMDTITTIRMKLRKSGRSVASRLALLAPPSSPASACGVSAFSSAILRSIQMRNS